jgi:hypothetical protein
VHPGVVPDLEHGGVDDGELCLAFDPGSELGLVIFPLDVSVFGLEAFVHADSGVKTLTR